MIDPLPIGSNLHCQPIGCGSWKSPPKSQSTPHASLHGIIRIRAIKSWSPPLACTVSECSLPTRRSCNTHMSEASPRARPEFPSAEIQCGPSYETRIKRIDLRNVRAHWWDSWFESGEFRPWSLGFGCGIEPCKELLHRERCLDSLLDGHAHDSFEFGPQCRVRTSTAAPAGNFHFRLRHAPSMAFLPGFGKHRNGGCVGSLAPRAHLAIPFQIDSCPLVEFVVQIREVLTTNEERLHRASNSNSGNQVRRYPRSTAASRLAWIWAWAAIKKSGTRSSRGPPALR